MGLIIYFTIVILFGIIYYLRLGKPKIIEDSVNYDLCLKVNIIAYKTIDTAMKLYGIKNDIDEFLIFTLINT